MGHLAADTNPAGTQKPGKALRKPEKAALLMEEIVMRKLVPVVGPLLAAVLAMVPILGAILAAVVA